MSSSPRSSTPSLAETLRRQVVPVLIWVLLALVLRWAVLEPRWIPSGSMLPALQLQDRVLVEKLRHGPSPWCNESAGVGCILAAAHTGDV